MMPRYPSEVTRAGGLAQVARSSVEAFLAGPARPGPAPVIALGDEEFLSVSRAGGDDVRARPVTLVVDCSGSMAYRGRAGASKFEFARLVAASLGYLLLTRHTAVGLVVHDTHIRTLLPPRGTGKHLLGLFRCLEATRPAGAAAIARVWHQLAVRHLPPGGKVVLISDAFDQPAPIARALRVFRQRKHDVSLLQVLAPDEMDFPFTRTTRFRNLEQPNDVLRVDAGGLRREYLANVNSHLQALRRSAAEQGIGYHLLRTDGPVDRALTAFLTGPTSGS